MNAIEFKHLRFINDSHLIITGLLINPDDHESTVKTISDDFINEGIISEGKLLEMIFIENNVEGENGRKDWLAVTSPGTKINPIRRLGFGFVKWPSDFIVNYSDDYYDGPTNLTAKFINNLIDWVINSGESYYYSMKGKTHNLESILLDNNNGLLLPLFPEDETLSMEEVLNLFDNNKLAKAFSILLESFSLPKNLDQFKE